MIEATVHPRAAAGRVLVPDLPADVIALPHWSQRNTTLLVTLDVAEHARREATETGPVPYDSMGLLDALMALPEGIEVPLRTLERPYDRRTVRGAAPAGAVDVHQGPGGPLVVRRAVRPLRVHLAVVSHFPRHGLDQASAFAPFCARALLLGNHPKADFLFEADFYGIGVAVGSPVPQAGQDPPVPVLAPDAWTPMRHTPAGWWFAETAYKQLLTHPDLIPTTNGAC
jgi:hypothetical protein